jgi:hypothetical protein
VPALSGSYTRAFGLSTNQRLSAVCPRLLFLSQRFKSHPSLLWKVWPRAQSPLASTTSARGDGDRAWSSRQFHVSSSACHRVATLDSGPFGKAPSDSDVLRRNFSAYVHKVSDKSQIQKSLIGRQYVDTHRIGGSDSMHCYVLMQFVGGGAR